MITFARPASAVDLASYAVVPQFGHSYGPTAIAIALDGRWFATATRSEIYLWDIKTGAVLRRLDGPHELRFLALAKDGSLVLARDEADKLWAWRAETGAAVSPAVIPAAGATVWNDIGHYGQGRLNLYHDDAKKYLSDRQLDSLIHAKDSWGVTETNLPGVVEVDFRAVGDDQGSVAFIDVEHKKLLAELPPPVSQDMCGEPFGTFALQGNTLVLSPTEYDASHFFGNAEVIDVGAKPPVIKWKHFCRDFMFSDIEMEKGLILSGPTPDQLTIWDPSTARALARLEDVHSSDSGPDVPADNTGLAISADKLTFAFPSSREPPGQAQEFGFSVRRSNETKFYKTSHEVNAVRLDADSRTVFAETDAGWQAWDIATARAVPGPIVPPPADAAFDARERHSPDGKYRRVDLGTRLVDPRDSGDPGERRAAIEDSSGRVIVTVTGRFFFSEDSLHAWSYSKTQGQSVVLWDLKSGKPLWTATDFFDTSDAVGVLVMEFPDGRVRLSEGAEKMVKLVRGFDARPFDKAAEKLFLER